MEILKVKKRNIASKKAKELREEGLIPAVLYGPKIEPQEISINQKEFLKVFKETGMTSMIEIKIGSQKEKHMTMIKSYQLDPLTDNFVHVDFYQPILSQKIEAQVPLKFIGESPAVKEKDGVLINNISELEIMALPLKVPSEIEVDISVLREIEDVVRVGDIDFPEEIEVLREDSEVVASISVSQTAEELMEEMDKGEDDLFVGEEVSLDEGEKETKTEKKEGDSGGQGEIEI